MTEIWTIGHSTRPIDVFLSLLRANAIEALADVRRHPGSRRQPQYQSDVLRDFLQAAGIDYHWMPSLGGRRKASAAGKATAWKNAGFQGYADYLGTAEFATALDLLKELARQRRTAIMCAEALWWKCHRRLIADALVASGTPVSHIVDRGVEPHRLISPARIVDGELSYEPEGTRDMRLGTGDVGRDT